MTARNGKASTAKTGRVKVRCFPTDDEGAKRWPNLFDLLCPLTESSGKQASEAGSLSLRIDGSYYRVTVTVASDKASTSFSAVTLVDLLDQVEQHLTTTRDWVTSYTEKKKLKSRWKRD